MMTHKRRRMCYGNSLASSSIFCEKEILTSTRRGPDLDDLDYVRFLRLTTGEKMQFLKHKKEDNNLPMDDDYMRFMTHQEKGSNAHFVEDDIDICYKTFLEHLREDGKSYIFEMINGEDKTPVYVKYEAVEEGDEAADDVKPEIWRGSGSVLSVDRRTFTGQKRKLKVSGCAGKGNGSLKPKSDKVISHPSSPDHGSQTDQCLVDDSYKKFLDHVRVCGDSFVLELEDGTSLHYEEETQVLTASKSLKRDRSQSCDEKQMIAYRAPQMDEVDESSMDSLYDDGPSYFKNRLMAVLSEPYDDGEYEHLWQLVNSRQPKKRQRDLRRRSISYTTPGKSMSYLDLYPDLAKQFKSADPYQALTLMRGFFFWLKNLCHEGAFRPWVTPLECNAMVPISASEMQPLQVALPDDFGNSINTMGLVPYQK